MYCGNGVLMRGDCLLRDGFLLLLCMHMGGAPGELAVFFVYA